MPRLMAGIRREWMEGEGRIPIFPEIVDRLRSDLARFGITFGFMVESGVGEKVGLTDRDWKKVGSVTNRPELFYEGVDIVLGVKQPSWNEVAQLGERPEVQGICCFLHANANREIVERLLEKEKVKILPLECNGSALAAMSREAGRRIPDILDRCLSPGSWQRENILFIGGRGTVSRHAIGTLFSSGVGLGQIIAFDLEAGLFAAHDLGYPLTYQTFSINNDDLVREGLKMARIIVCAALGRDGVAPKILTTRHLEILSNQTLIIQVSSDEGGNIADERFCRSTNWDDPIYEVRLGAKVLYVCNVTNIPGCVRPVESSRALEQANYDYYLEIFRTWPDVPEQYLLTRLS